MTHPRIGHVPTNQDHKSLFLLCYYILHYFIRQRKGEYRAQVILSFEVHTPATCVKAVCPISKISRKKKCVYSHLI